MEWMSEEKPETADQLHTTLGEMRCNMAGRGFEDVSNTEFLKTLNIYYYKYRERIKKDGTNLQKFWFSYIELCELLLNLVYSTRTGEWEFYLSCVERVLPWAFTYDRQNYARYLIPFLNDMRALPYEKPNILPYANGEFAVQMSSENTFCRNEADKTIENTINRDCKTSCGYIGFSANFSATQRLVLQQGGTLQETIKRAVGSKVWKIHP